ncbi:MAG TPA: lipoprotein signal peptidase [Saprospiraceae bacterium]|nr:lipoprotein signal peptidase [Saprospiraceae bacterium]HMP24584.1 lipoprotein signal peptidase [Saprospiraceae bacterium]
MSRSAKVLAIIILVLLVDQALKIWIKTNMTYGEEFGILGLSWARIHFVENPGMAFGIEFGGGYGKLALSLFRILAVGFLIYYLRQLIQSHAPMGLLASFALILAGAFGNIIDSAFYGLIFSESSYHGVATMFPEGGGYAGFLYGKVVDMFYFPLYDGTLPEWVPFWGGEEVLFFRPVFNVADSAITAGVLAILIFQRSFFNNPKKEEDTGQPALETTASDTPEYPASSNEHNEHP